MLVLNLFPILINFLLIFSPGNVRIKETIVSTNETIIADESSFINIKEKIINIKTGIIIRDIL